MSTRLTAGVGLALVRRRQGANNVLAFLLSMGVITTTTITITTSNNKTTRVVLLTMFHQTIVTTTTITKRELHSISTFSDMACTFTQRITTLVMVEITTCAVITVVCRNIPHLNNRITNSNFIRAELFSSLRLWHLALVYEQLFFFIGMHSMQTMHYSFSIIP